MKNVGKKFLLVLMGLLLALTFALGCQKPVKEEKKKPVKVTVTEPTKDNPLVVDSKAKKVKVYTEVNGKYFSETTRHGVVFKDGSNGDKSILRAYANQNDFHDALIKIGAKPGNKITLESPPGSIVEGDLLNVKVSWNDEEYDFADIVKAEPDQGFEVRFGGNADRAREKFTGCILCLDSCPVGITSNAKWGTG